MNSVEQTTSASGGFPNKHYFFVSLTESADCVSAGSEQCCYRTADLIYKDTAPGQSCLLKCGYPTSYNWPPLI
jgi:hypothetical protein